MLLEFPKQYMGPRANIASATDSANTCAEACHAPTAHPCLDPRARALAGRRTPANQRPEARVTVRTHMFRGAYEPPKNPQHQELYEFLKKLLVLEKFSDGLSALRLIAVTAPKR